MWVCVGLKWSSRREQTPRERSLYWSYLNKDKNPDKTKKMIKITRHKLHQNMKKYNKKAKKYPSRPVKPFGSLPDWPLPLLGLRWLQEGGDIPWVILAGGVLVIVAMVVRVPVFSTGPLCALPSTLVII